MAEFMPGANKYLYKGRELQDEQLGGVNLDWCDQGARFYERFSDGVTFIEEPKIMKGLPTE